MGSRSGDEVALCNLAAQERAMGRDRKPVDAGSKLKAMQARFLALIDCAFNAHPMRTSVSCLRDLTVGWGQQGTECGVAVGIRVLENAWTVGQSRNDTHALNLIFDNALVYVEYGKLVTKGEYLSRIKHASPQTEQIVMGP